MDLYFKTLRHRETQENISQFFTQKTFQTQNVWLQEPVMVSIYFKFVFTLQENVIDIVGIDIVDIDIVDIDIVDIDIDLAGKCD